LTCSHPLKHADQTTLSPSLLLPALHLKITVRNCRLSPSSPIPQKEKKKVETAKTVNNKTRAETYRRCCKTRIPTSVFHPSSLLWKKRNPREMEIEIRFRAVRNFEKVAAVRMQNNGVRFLLHFVSLLLCISVTLVLHF